MNNFNNKVQNIVHEIDGISDWMIITGDAAWSDIANGWKVSNKETWLKHTYGRQVVVQAGGNNGMYPRLFSKIFGHVYTFEPIPLNFHCLVNNCQAENITKINGVLGDVHRMVHLSGWSDRNPGGGRVDEADGYIPMFMIDDLDLKACDLIQLDVEGFEADVLLGASKTIEKFLPAISLERGNQVHLDILSRWGYKQVDVTFDDIVYTSHK